MKFIPFESIAKRVEEILPNQDLVKWNFLPDDLHMLAENNGITLKWIPIKWWNGFEYGIKEIDDKTFVQELFQDKIPVGDTFVITDECWDNKEGLLFDFQKLNEFIRDYENYFDLVFFQASDIIFVNPKKGLITILHHDGYHTQFYRHS